MWKTLTGLLKHRFTSEILFNDVLHGFQVGRGTVTSALEANLIQQLTSMREAVLHEMFLGLQKVYGDLYRYRCIGILVGYCVVPRALWVLRTYRGHLTIVAKSRGYYPPPSRDTVV